jgi:hypothetical protein
MGLGSGIQKNPIPDPGSKGEKATDPGSAKLPVSKKHYPVPSLRIRIHNTVSKATKMPK